MTHNFTHRDVPYDITVITETTPGPGGIVQSSKIRVGVNGRRDGLFDAGCSAAGKLETEIEEIKEKVECWIDVRIKTGRAMPV